MIHGSFVLMHNTADACCMSLCGQGMSVQRSVGLEWICMSGRLNKVTHGDLKSLPSVDSWPIATFCSSCFVYEWLS